MRRAALPLLVLLCCQPDEPPARSRQEIIGGVLAPDDAQVFFIHDSVSACTGSLIAPRTILTARHCVNQGTLFASNPPSSTDTFMVLEAVTWTDVHPDAGIVDLALLYLERAPPVTPFAWNWWTTVPINMGTPVRHIGYGGIEDGGGGERRTVTSTTGLTFLDPMSGWVVLSGSRQAGVCYGDSGGPALGPGADGGGEVQLAVNVRLADTQCGPVASVVLSKYRDFIEDWLRTHEDAGCPRDDRCVGGCFPDDPDCVPPGIACTSPLQCPERRCVTDPQHPAAYCATPCGAGCGAGFQCDATQDACIIEQRPEASLGQPCDAGITLCRSSTCLEGACRTACTDDTACTVSTEHCREPEPRYCVPPVVGPALAFNHPAAHTGCSAVGALAPLLAGLALMHARRRRGDRLFFRRHR